MLTYTRDGRHLTASKIASPLDPLLASLAHFTSSHDLSYKARPQPNIFKHVSGPSRHLRHVALPSSVHVRPYTAPSYRRLQPPPSVNIHTHVHTRARKHVHASTQARTHPHEITTRTHLHTNLDAHAHEHLFTRCTHGCSAHSSLLTIKGRSRSCFACWTRTTTAGFAESRCATVWSGLLFRSVLCVPVCARARGRARDTKAQARPAQARPSVRENDTLADAPNPHPHMRNRAQVYLTLDDIDVLTEGLCDRRGRLHLPQVRQQRCEKASLRWVVRKWVFCERVCTRACLRARLHD